MKIHQLCIAMLFSALVSVTSLLAQNYSLALSLSGSGSGSIFVNGSERTLFPVTYWFVSGTSVELLASPDANCRFDGWTGDFTSSDPALSFTITSHMSLTAKFDALPNLVSYDFLILDNTGPDIEYITNLQNNSSAAVASSFYNDIYLSEDKNINPLQDYWIDTWICSPLGPYETRGPAGGTRNLYINSVPAGEYYLCWYIDAYNAVEEFNEDDNKVYVNDTKIIIESTSVEEPTDGNTVTKSFILHQNYPNPFNPSTEFQYLLPVKSHVQLTVHDMQGRIIRHLDSDIKPAGTYSVTWDGYDVLNHPVPTGVYFIVLKAGDFTQTKKALLIR